MTPVPIILNSAEPETPRDGYGAGYILSSIREEFHDLCRLIGFEAARQEMAEVINDERERKQ